MKKTQTISQRASDLLKQLVASYLADGQPVASKQLAENAGLAISSATIRNVMSGLEKKGLIASPHTSAGRIPTCKGLRLFVDSLLEIEPVEQLKINQLQKNLNPDTEHNSLINKASQLVSQMTQMAGIITVPAQTQAKLRHIEFLPLPDKRILAILVTNEKDVQNKVLHTTHNYTESELHYAANFLNQRFSGQNLSVIRKALIQDIETSRQDVNSQMKTVIEVAEKALSSVADNEPKLIVQGKANLVRYAQTNDKNQLQHLFDVFDRKREMLGLFDRCVQTDGIKIFIGQEAGLEGLGDRSVITAPYCIAGKAVGVLGVIGPARMNYNQVIPVVDITAKLLGEALNGNVG